MKACISSSASLLIMLVLPLALAEEPPLLLNYQGVLRDETGDALTGDVDMIFEFYDSDGGPNCTGGTLLFTDAHTQGASSPVGVNGGMFDVALGSGSLTPGFEPTFDAVFRRHEDVYLQVDVKGETLCPRVRVLSTAYALNGDSLDGIDSTQFLRSDAGAQFHGGTFTIMAGHTFDGIGDVKAWRFYDRNNVNYYLDPSAEVSGNFAGHLRIGNASGLDDDYIYFDAGNEYVRWQDDETRFAFSDDVYTARDIYAASLYDVGNINYSVDPAGLSVLWGLDINDGSIGINQDGPDFNQHIYFYENGDPFGAFLRWDDGNDQFALSDTLYASGDNFGIRGAGVSAGGYFTGSTSSGAAYVAYGDYGADCRGNTLGVRGKDENSDTYAYLAYGSSSTYGNGMKNFVQNHPYKQDQQIVYAAAEGNEAATFTRGSARLAGGEARVALDETFAWVTNPDIGLTAQITARAPGAQLYVAGLSTNELVVRSEGGSPDAAFDYMVWGLRVGFEEISILQEKGLDEARIPAMMDHRTLLSEHPEWRKHQPLERYRTMQASLGDAAAPDLSASEALRAAIGVYDPAIHGANEEQAPPAAEARGDDVIARGSPIEAGFPVAERIEGVKAIAASGLDGAERPAFDNTVSRFPLLDVEGSVAVGDLLAVDARGVLRVSSLESDAAVMGVVAGVPVEVEGALRVPVASYGMVMLKVDADRGAILPGDLLVSSATPGHAMRAYAEIPGTVIAKALEPLAAGRETIRVLVMPR